MEIMWPGYKTFNGRHYTIIINALTGAETFYDLQFNTVGPGNSTCNITVTNNLSITNGAYPDAGQNFTARNRCIQSGTLTHSSGWIYGTFSRWQLRHKTGLTYFSRSVTILRQKHDPEFRCNRYSGSIIRVNSPECSLIRPGLLWLKTFIYLTLCSPKGTGPC